LDGDTAWRHERRRLQSRHVQRQFHL
jgi:hypothetical protein